MCVCVCVCVCMYILYLVINSTILKHIILNYIYVYMFVILTPELPDEP
jgi:hypothetical protein